jgi:hypothetical protein
MARPCGCDGPCLSGRYGAYTVLVHVASADRDPVRHQQAMAFIATIGPMAGSIGADGSCPGDSLAAPMLDRLYPAGPQPDPRATIAAIEAEAQAAFAAIIAGATP